MRKPFCLTFVIFTCLSTILFASSIKKITLTELRSKATCIVTGEVIHVVKKDNQDIIYILVDSYLKGNSSQVYFNFTLISRGGLKDFDPALSKGDTGVFFLKKTDKKWKTKKAYWGSVATFQKNLFHISEKKKKSEKELSEIQIGTGTLSDLQKAAFRGNVKTIRQILNKLDKQETVNALAKGSNSLYGYSSPLRLAVRNNQTEAVKELIVFGADVNESGFYSLTPLANAAAGGHVKIVKLLLNAGAKIDTAPDGKTAVMCASWSGQPKILKLLLEAKANPNLARHDGRTALHFAAIRGSLECVKLLLKYGANTKAIAYGRDTPLSDAELRKHKEVAKLLREHMKK